MVNKKELEININKCVELRKAGLTYKEISVIVKRPYGTVKRWLDEKKYRDNIGKNNPELLEKIQESIKLRNENLTYKEISKIMNRPLGTIKRWISHLNIPIVKSEEHIKNMKKGSLVMQKNAENKRAFAYESAMENAPKDLEDRLLRDFVNLYIGEGSKREISSINIVNTDSNVILLSFLIMYKYFLKEGKKLVVRIKYYEASHNPEELLSYWKKTLGEYDNVEFRLRVQPIKELKPHNNSNKLGLVSLLIHDTCEKIKLFAYMDYINAEWQKEFFKFNGVEINKTAYNKRKDKKNSKYTESEIEDDFEFDYFDTIGTNIQNIRKQANQSIVEQPVVETAEDALKKKIKKIL